MLTDLDKIANSATPTEAVQLPAAFLPRAVEGSTTFLFTDVEGSSKLWQRHPDGMRIALLRHDQIVSELISASDGTVFKTIGDAFCSAFENPRSAINAIVQIQLALAAEKWPDGLHLRIRAAINAGPVEHRDGDYFGAALTVVNRLLGLAHGGQTLISSPFHAMALPLSIPGITYRDLGSHRLKGIDLPDHVFQVNVTGLQSEFPPLRTIEHASTNLPQDLTEFVGRKREVADIIRLLSQTRLLSLVGPGGIGKTRLALHAAHEAIDNFADGVWLVQLDSIIESGNVLRAIAAALSIVEEPGRELRDIVRDCLRPKPVLLILDNCEHVVDECGSVVTNLLQTCPYLVILATTQEALKVPGEVIWAVPTLGLPMPEEADRESLMNCDASHLFVSRAALAMPGLAINDRNAKIIARICASLDGHPLAIELAAARVNALTLEQIAQRLDDRFKLLRGGNRNVRARHQTLRATLEWSYELLAPKERILLDRISVFVGGWTLDAAEAVSVDTDFEDDVLDILTRLIDKSMVIFDSEASRYRMLESIRQYAAEKLREAGQEDAMLACHARCYALFVATTETELWMADQALHLELLEADLGNLRAALTYFQDNNMVDDAIRIAGNLYRFWHIRGYMQEGLGWLTRSLAASSPGDRTSVRARALSAIGGLSWAQCNYDRAYSVFAESLEIRTELGDSQGIADTLNNMGQLATDQGKFGTARELLEKSLTLQRNIKDRQGISSSLSNLALLAQMQHDDDSAERQYLECLKLDREQEDHWSVANTLDGLARIAIRKGARAPAFEMLAESLKIRLQISDRPGLAEGIEAFGRLHAAAGDNARAVVMWGAAESSREALAVAISPCAAGDYAKAVSEVRSTMSEDMFNCLWQQGRDTTAERACMIALDVAHPSPSRPSATPPLSRGAVHGTAHLPASGPLPPATGG